MLTINITRTKQGFDDFALPAYATQGSAGADIRAAILQNITINSGEVAMIPTGLAVEIPEGYEIQVRSRSGLAAKNAVFCLNAPGTIDSDFRGEIHVLLANFGKEPFVVQRGDRIAQIVIAKYETAAWNEVQLLSPTSRGTGGFGSTGKQ
ncbi:MAG: dUTP diphosphatase [Candidatus Kapabacteria bacterium]|jgi:dUTP pyrophosphatase|nr:dUTP diphosphatase [Candidatus Kapabacteria bacterium]